MPRDYFYIDEATLEDLLERGDADLALINKADTLDDLKNAFANAYTKYKTKQAARDAITKAYNERKDALTNASSISAVIVEPTVLSNQGESNE